MGSARIVCLPRRCWLGGPNATMWPELLAVGAVGGYVAARRQRLAAERDRQEPSTLRAGRQVISLPMPVALGGTLEAGPRPGGGFRVHARLPVTPAAAGLTGEGAAQQRVSRP